MSEVTAGSSGRGVVREPACFQPRNLLRSRLVLPRSCSAGARGSPSPARRAPAPLRAGGGGALAVLSCQLCARSPPGAGAGPRAPAFLQTSHRPGPAGPAPWVGGVRRGPASNPVGLPDQPRSDPDRGERNPDEATPRTASC